MVEQLDPSDQHLGAHMTVLVVHYRIVQAVDRMVGVVLVHTRQEERIPLL
jgi:hypothetical protein